jgi:hypothetical protein
MMGILNDDDWRFFTQFTFNIIDTVANTPEEHIMCIECHNLWLLLEVDVETIELMGLAKTQSESKKCNSIQTRKSRIFHDRGSESE